MASDIVIDLSHHNVVRSFHDAAASGIRLVIHKATEGISMRDPAYAANLSRVKKVQGLSWGAYHFGTSADVTKQVANFLSVAKDTKLLALDWEGNGSETMSTNAAEEFVQQVFDKTKRWPLLYSGNLLKESKISSDSPLKNCELWLAQYSATPHLPAGWTQWRLWQHTDHGDVPGVGACDRSKFNGSASDLEPWLTAL